MQGGTRERDILSTYVEALVQFLKTQENDRNPIDGSKTKQLDAAVLYARKKSRMGGGS